MTYHQDDPLNIDTPENVTFAYDVAGIGSRFMSAAIDTVIIIVGQILITILMLAVPSTLRDQLSSFGDIDPWLLAVYGVFSFLMYWGYYIFFEMTWNGQTPGKRRVKLRVVRVDGTPITLSESLIRNIVRIVDFLPFNYAVGIVVMFTNKQSRRLGDLAAGTLVIRDQKQEISLESLNTRRTFLEARQVERPSLDGFGLLPIEKLRDSDIHLAKEYLSRRQSQGNISSLGDKILTAMLNRMEIPMTSEDIENVTMLLRRIVDFYDYQNIQK